MSELIDLHACAICGDLISPAERGLCGPCRATLAELSEPDPKERSDGS